MKKNKRELWKSIFGYEDTYQVSDIGNVRNIKTGKLMKLSKIANGNYLTVGLSRNNKQKHFYVHRLVLSAFIGESPIGWQACHNDGNSLNNALKNIRWGTCFSNAMDRSNHNKGKKVPMGWDGFIIKVLRELIEGK